MEPDKGDTALGRPSGSDPPPPLSPAARYLQELARGHPISVAIDLADISPASLVIARQDAEFLELEQTLSGCSVRGARPAIAKALLEHHSIGAAQRLISEIDGAPHARDRINAAEGVLDRVQGLRPGAQPGAGGGIQISAAQVSMLVLQLSPEQLAALAARAQSRSEGPDAE